MADKFVIVNEHDGGGVFCIGIESDFNTAVGKVMCDIWDFKRGDYDGPDDVFQVSDPYELEGDSGTGICVTYKAASWENPCKDYYFILEYFNDRKRV